MTSEAVRNVDLAGDTAGWESLARQAQEARFIERDDQPSPLQVFGDPEGDAATERELEVRAAVEAENGPTPLAVLNGGKDADQP